jgi:hypothetical protein
VDRTNVSIGGSAWPIMKDWFWAQASFRVQEVDKRIRPWGIVPVLLSIGDIVALLDVVFMLPKNSRTTNPHTEFGTLAIQSVFGILALCWAGK